ncbi:MAG: type II toxin-antitoxin system RelE/ParE family toxin [Clostridiales bacterium]|nr:type II toxin-antitoxin system RelE/ParE family toxin [Clostridiales bacterium]
MAYKVVVTPDAEADLDRFLAYLIVEKDGIISAKNVLNDFEETKAKLSEVAGNLKPSKLISGFAN